MARSLITFLLNGPMHQTFEDWFETLSGEFPNRHAVGHGKFEKAYFTEEMSLKLFLLLDTLHSLFSADTDE